MQKPQTPLFMQKPGDGEKKALNRESETQKTASGSQSLISAQKSQRSVCVLSGVSLTCIVFIGCSTFQTVLKFWKSVLCDVKKGTKTSLQLVTTPPTRWKFKQEVVHSRLMQGSFGVGKTKNKKQKKNLSASS